MSHDDDYSDLLSADERAEIAAKQHSVSEPTVLPDKKYVRYHEMGRAPTAENFTGNFLEEALGLSSEDRAKAEQTFNSVLAGNDALRVQARSLRPGVHLGKGFSVIPEEWAMRPSPVEEAIAQRLEVLSLDPQKANVLIVRTDATIDLYAQTQRIAQIQEYLRAHNIPVVVMGMPAEMALEAMEVDQSADAIRQIVREEIARHEREQYKRSTRLSLTPHGFWEGPIFHADGDTSDPKSRRKTGE